MKTLAHATELRAGSRPVCLAIGFFDGVHLGHQQVLRQALNDARDHEGVALAVTFDRHPNAVVAPDRAPPLIHSLSQKLETLRAFGLDNVLLLEFTPEFSRKTGEEFVREMARDLGRVQSVCVGANFVFGHRRGGDVELLRRMGRDLGFTVHGLAAVALDGKTVSSTAIREAIAEGRLDDATQMLGRAYSLGGKVVPGDQLGRGLGFPTANLDTTGLVLPPHGVYAVHVEAAGRSLRGVLNIGLRPTLASPAPTLRVEAHLLDFEGDLYGQNLVVTPVLRLRPERRFAGLEELKAQIARDIAEARKAF